MFKYMANSTIWGMSRTKNVKTSQFIVWKIALPIRILQIDKLLPIYFKYYHAFFILQRNHVGLYNLSTDYPKEAWYCRLLRLQSSKVAAHLMLYLTLSQSVELSGHSQKKVSRNLNRESLRYIFYISIWMPNVSYDCWMICPKKRRAMTNEW